MALEAFTGGVAGGRTAGSGGGKRSLRSEGEGPGLGKGRNGPFPAAPGTYL